MFQVANICKSGYHSLSSLSFIGATTYKGVDQRFETSSSKQKMVFIFSES